MRIGRTGEKVFSIPIQQDAKKRYGAPYLTLHRADLIEILKRAAEFAGVRIRLNARVAAYVREDTGLRIGLDTGAHHSCRPSGRRRWRALDRAQADAGR